MEPDFLRNTRASYDAVAVRYAEWLRDELAAKPLDRAILACFAELVRDAGQGPVADIGCRAGRVTAHLNELGESRLFRRVGDPEMSDQLARVGLEHNAENNAQTV